MKIALMTRNANLYSHRRLIEVATERIPATPSIRSFYDPMNERVRL